MATFKAKRAVVLAAGFGKRLQPLTFVQPKPLMPVCGVPMLERVLLMLEGWGVEEIAVNAHYQAEKIRRYIASRKSTAKVIVSEEPEILGTGGALNPLATFLNGEPFWLVNGDVVMDGFKPEPVVKAFEESGRFAGCWISEDFGPRTIEVDPEGRVCNWKSDVAGDWGTFTYCGVALLSAEVMKYLPSGGFSTIVDAYEKAMMTDARFVVGATESGAYWCDAGTFERYLEAHAALNPDEFEENPNVLFEGVKLLSSADLTGCVVTGGLVGGEFVKTALVGVDQIGRPDLEALAKAWGKDSGDVAAEYLGARGSNREFWRFVCGDERGIAISYDDGKRPENGRYSSAAKVLASAGIGVPAVLVDIPEKKVLLIEDMGTESLQTVFRKRGSSRIRLFTPVVEALAKFHLKGTEAVLAEELELEKSFDMASYEWEHGLFEKFAVKERYGFDGLPSDAVSELRDVASRLIRSRPVLVHRDFQSSNVLYRKDGTPVFIDFQGMRLGCAMYDLASLLYDPYVELDDSERKALVKVYAKAAPELAETVDLLPLAAVQRLVQVVGAFGRLASVGHAEFLKYISKALENLLSAADDADLDAVGAFVEELIARENIREGRLPVSHHDHDEDGGHCNCH